MMQDVSIETTKEELRTIEIGCNNVQSPGICSPEKIMEPYSNFGSEMSCSDEDDALEVDSFLLEENDIGDGDQGLEASKFLLAAESDGQGIQTVDPQTQARLEALLEAAGHARGNSGPISGKGGGISKLPPKDGKVMSDPDVLRTLTSSVSSALDEAAQALHRMRDSQGQLMPGDGMNTEANGESESIGHRPGSGNVADANEEGESLLSLACSAGYYELAQVLLAMKANVEDRGIKGDCTPLMEAASGGHVDIVRLLLLHHADINAQSSAGNTPLHYGACGGFKDVVLELVMNGANVEIHNENGHTPLMEAASAGHVEVAKILLEHGAGINTHSNEFKESALTLACYKGHLDMVKFLLEAGADQEHKTDEMHTALMEASMDGHVEVARLLLDSGAQVNMPADSFESPLTLAACGGHIELAGLLIERGANIEEVNDEGYTPLMEAAREGHEDMVALLLSQGADLNAQTEETQETALTLACCGGFLEVADFLIRSGAFIELGCSTPLMEAAQEGHLELVSFLLQSGANVEAETGTGDTALTYACENGHTDVAEALLDCGASLEHESEGGRTPLMKAARAGHLCTVQFLISKGADVNRTTSSNDHTVLSLSCAGGHLAVVELLLQHFADYNHKLKDGSTMVIEAAKGGHTQVVKLLLEWPNQYIVHTATDQLTHLCVADTFEEPRVPVQGLANIVPPSEPDSQIPLAAANLATGLQGAKSSELSRQSLQKNLAKRLNSGQVDAKVGNKFCSPENFQQFFGDANLISDRIVDKDETLYTNQPSKEEQIQRKQQILEELKKVEQELQDKAQSHLLLTAQEFDEHQAQAKFRQAAASFPLASQFGPAGAVVAAAESGTVSKAEQLAKQNEELAKLLELPGHTMGLIDPHNLDQIDMTKILAWNENHAAEASCPEACLQTVKAHFQQQGQVLQRPAPPPPSQTSTMLAIQGGAPAIDSRSSSGGKIQVNKRNGSVKQNRMSKTSQPLQQSPPPPPPPPPPMSVVHSAKGPLLLPLSPQQTGTQAQPIVFNTDHNGASQLVDASQILTSASQVMLDTSQCQQHQSLAQQISLQQQQQMLSLPTQQQLLAYPQLIPQQEQLLQQMLNQPSLQHQLQMQHGFQQVQCGQQYLQSVTSTQMTAAHAPQMPQQVLQQQQLKLPANTSNHNVAVTKTQFRKQQRVAQTPQQTVIHQNSIVNVDGTLPPNGTLGSSMNSLYSSVDVDSQTESNHDTALTLACAGGHGELVSLLLSKGADIEHRDKKGFTPLILAATAGHVDVVEVLLDHGADIEAQSERTKDTPLSLACSGGRYEVVELLLIKGSNKEHRNVSDYTPLSLAASGGYVNIIRLLLNHNAEINSRTGSKLGISPLMLAAMNGHTAAVKLLLDQGSDINAQIETNRNTALTLACFQGRHEVVSLLVDRKANIEHRAKTGLTPLMEAASGGYVEVGRVLLDKGADVNAPPVPSSRDTALTIAADKGHYRFVELLLHRGAAVDVKNKKGNSPLWLACNGGHSDVVSLLVQADADIDSQDNRKVSCLMASFRRGHIKVVKWMVKKVTQFPSENEIKRYIATITDKELQKKCNQCADIIVAAKERQAAEANKNADSLLEEIKQEKEQAALKAELASKRRERRRERKRKGKRREEKDKDSGKNSSPEPDGESNNSKKDEEEEDEDEEDDSSSEPPVTPALVGKVEAAQKDPKAKTLSTASNKCQSLPECQQTARIPPNMTPLAVSTSTASATKALNGHSSSATARANRDARKKQQKAARESRCEGSDQDSGLRNVKAELSKKDVSQVPQIPVAKFTAVVESAVITVAAPTGRPAATSTAQVISNTSQDIFVSNVAKSHPSTGTSPTASTQSFSASNTGSNKNNYINVVVNGGGSRAGSKKSSDIKHSSSTGIGDLDDFGVIPGGVVKNFDKINGTGQGTKKLNDSKMDWIDEYRYFEKTLPTLTTRQASSAPSPRKGQKKEEGWKEVIRKNVSKKLSVPANVISRLIGKGGCNINAIRELSGAHVEVEKSKGAAERTVTMKGSPEAIRQANNLINAMIDEPDKDITELLARASKAQKPPAEKAPVQKAPVAITDFAIGTFTVPTTSSSQTATSTRMKSPGNAKSGKHGAGQSNSHSSSSSTNTMGPTIGAWQNPVPGQVLPSSPRRSPQKQVTPNLSMLSTRPVMAESSDKGSVRQLMFGIEKSNRLKSPASATPSSTVSLSFTPMATSTNRGGICATLPNPGINKPQDQRMQNQNKSGMATGLSTTSPGVRFPRPVSSIGLRVEGMPLPIVTSCSSGIIEQASQVGNGTLSGQPMPGDYSPFNNNLFTNFLPKKEEPADKMDFASVAAAGVVTTSPSPHTTTNPSPSTISTIIEVDPALQAKAPGYNKLNQQGNSPPYRPDVNPSMGGYMLPVGCGAANHVPGPSVINSGIRHMAPMSPFMDDYHLNQIRQYQYINQQLMENCNPMLQTALLGMEIGAGLAMMPGVYPHGIPSIPMPPGQQQHMSQKEEYSKPHSPMTLPEIKGGLNPNAPEFQLSSNGPPLMNGFDRLSNTPLGGMGRLAMADVGGRASLGPSAAMEGSSHNVSPNPGSVSPMMHPEILGASVQYLLHQQHLSGSGMVTADPHSSQAPVLMGPTGVGNFLSQSLPQRTHSSMQNLAGVRPSSAPSVQPVDPGIMSAPRSGSPMSTRTPPPPLDHTKHIQPIGGERRKGPPRPGPAPNAASCTNLWSFGDSAAYSSKWSDNGSPVMRAASLPTTVLTTAVVPGGGMIYPGMPDAEEEVMDYGVQSQVSYNDAGVPGGDGDHDNMRQPPAMMMPPVYSNGPYPMAPMFHPKGIVGDSQAPHVWNPALTLVPSSQGDNERWQSWSQ